MNPLFYIGIFLIIVVIVVLLILILTPDKKSVSDKKYIVLEHLQLPNRGFRFWTMNSEDNTRSVDGKLWYKEILFTDSTDEAVIESRKTNTKMIPTHQELMDYHKDK